MMIEDRVGRLRFVFWLAEDAEQSNVTRRLTIRLFPKRLASKVTPGIV